MKKHAEITRESVLQAITVGAKSISAIAMSHGYAKPVSGSVTKKIRTIVPDVAELLTGKSDAKPVAEKASEVVKVAKVAKQDIIVCGTFRKCPYGGKLYGRVFKAAVDAGRTEFRPFVKIAAVDLELTEKQVFVAANVMRIPRHQSNGNRSKDIANERGFMHLVAIEQVEQVEQVEQIEKVEKSEKIAG